MKIFGLFKEDPLWEIILQNNFLIIDSYEKPEINCYFNTQTISWNIFLSDPPILNNWWVTYWVLWIEVHITLSIQKCNKVKTSLFQDLENQFRDRERVSVSSRPDLIAGTRENETRDVTRDCRVSLYELATCHVPTGSVVSPALRSVRQETMFKTSKLRLTNCLNDKSSTRLSCESKEEMLDQEKFFNECNSKRDREFFKIDLTLYLLSYHEMVNTCLNLHFLNVYEHSRIKK